MRFNKKLKNVYKLALMMIFTKAMALNVAAADDMWGTVTGFISEWIPRLGGAIVVIGLIMFGLGWQREDAEGKTRGIQVAIGGAIVAAVGLLAPTLMA
jgi:hypothetical protein